MTLDLVRKLAAVCNETPEPDPESWFRDTFGTGPDYSDLLDQLAKTQSERQLSLRTYWEPTEAEREVLMAAQKRRKVANTRYGG